MPDQGSHVPKIDITETGDIRNTGHGAVTYFLISITVALLTVVIPGCRTAQKDERSATRGVSVGFAGSLSGLYYPGYIRAFDRTEGPCPDTALPGACWAEVAKNTGPEMSQFGLKVRFMSKDAKTPSELLLNLETGEIAELGQSRVWKAPQQGGNFYEYTAKLQAMIDTLAKSKTVFPIEYVAGVLETLNESTDFEGVRAESYYSTFLRGQPNKLMVDYKAKESRELVLQFWTKKKLLSEKRTSVEKGTVRITAEVDIPAEVPEGIHARILVSLVVIGGSAAKAIAAMEILPVFSRP
jgi:hypothetical protein